MEKNKTWQRVATSKRYLHPPFSGYFCTQWPEFKVLMSKFQTKYAEMLHDPRCYSAGMCVLVGEELEAVNFKTTKMGTRDDGVPVHGMLNVQEKYALHMENFCNTGTVFPSTFIRITVANEGDEAVSDVLGLLLRSGREDYLTGTGVDGYITYDGNVANWGFLQPTWSWDGDNHLTDGQEYGIDVEAADGFTLSWHGAEKGYVWHQRHLLKASFTLQPGEEKSITLRFYALEHKEDLEGYDAEKKKAEKFWLAEIARLKRLPGTAEHEPMVRNFISQLLQMFTTYPDEGFVAPRQGGMNRFFWSVEAMEWLMALERLGDFREYTKTAYDFYFDKSQCKEGEDAGEVTLATKWGSTTAGAIRACAYCLQQWGQEEYLRYKDALYLAFGWIQRQRKKSAQQGSLYTGIFPAMKGTDWPGEFQSWCMSDGHSLMALKDLALAFEKHNDPHATEVRAEYDDYLASMKKILAAEVAKNTDPEELLLPNRLGIPQTDPPMGAYQGDGPAMLLQAGVMDPCSRETEMVESFFRNRKCMQRGLTGLMCDGRLRPLKETDSAAGHTWYLSTCDMRWFMTWMAQGRRDKAEEVIKAEIAYGMSDAYYFVERFVDNDPYYMPWQPNASNNGRLLMMLADFYGTRENNL